MKLKKEDKIKCIKDVIWENVMYDVLMNTVLFKKGKSYKIINCNIHFVEIDAGGYHGIVNFALEKGGTDYAFNSLRYYYDHFASEKELRKLKLDKINGKKL